MRTRHELRVADARELGAIVDGSVHLVVTSPPYPMIEMWDGCFAALDPGIAAALAGERAAEAFAAMHAALDRVWRELHRVLVEGGIACINIGDAARTLGGNFRLHPNHARVLDACTGLGFQNLPAILWRKPTNAPSKFMGSGMLPPGAYVTLEHEYVLVLRKGGLRAFRTEADRERRRESAFFWEERNAWFSDVWLGLTGTNQELPDSETRARSAAFPFELAFRLVCMFSVKGDTVLDPFAGTGTTLLAAMAAERHSLGLEIDAALAGAAEQRLAGAAPELNRYLTERLARHFRFVGERKAAGKELKHFNEPHGAACVSAQETALRIRRIRGIERAGPGVFTATYT
ncbi:MAG: site-specific DNA-methyltransferase [Planctomycetes bacterium]|nr:site-specific DNA-methyltransferase [Planctomycetota bacterium]